MRSTILSLAVAALLPGLPAAAQDLAVYAGAGLTFDNSRLTDQDAATKGVATDVNLYVEGESHHIYFGLSVDAINDTDSNYGDIYVGYRNSTESGLSYDLSYDKTHYPDAGDFDYDTIALSVGVPMGDVATVTFDADYYVYPDAKDLSDGYVTLDYYLNDKITLTGSVGLVGQDGDDPYVDGELAVAYQIGDQTSATLHYYDGSNYHGYFALDLNWDTTLLGE